MGCPGVLAAWIVVLAAAFFGQSATGSNYSAGAQLSGTPSAQAASLLQRAAPSVSGDVERIVFESKTGPVTSRAVTIPVDRMLARVAHLRYVATVTSPYSPGGANQVSTSRRIAFASVAVTTDRTVKMIGLGMAVAVLIDALLIRTVLVPAIMHIIGKANWSLPAALGRRLPRLELEAREEAEQAPPGPSPGAGWAGSPGSAGKEQAFRGLDQDLVPVRLLRRPVGQQVQQLTGVALPVRQVRPV